MPGRRRTWDHRRTPDRRRMPALPGSLGRQEVWRRLQPRARSQVEVPRSTPDLRPMQDRRSPLVRRPMLVRRRMRGLRAMPPLRQMQGLRRTPALRQMRGLRSPQGRRRAMELRLLADQRMPVHPPERRLRSLPLRRRSRLVPETLARLTESAPPTVRRMRARKGRATAPRASVPRTFRRDRLPRRCRQARRPRCSKSSSTKVRSISPALPLRRSLHPRPPRRRRPR